MVQGLRLGPAPHPLPVDNSDHTKGYTYTYDKYYPTVKEWGQYPRLRV